MCQTEIKRLYPDFGKTIYKVGVLNFQRCKSENSCFGKVFLKKKVKKVWG